MHTWSYDGIRSATAVEPFRILGLTCFILREAMLKRVGPFYHCKKDLNANLKIRIRLRGTCEGLKTLNEENEAIKRGCRRFIT